MVAQEYQALYNSLHINQIVSYFLYFLISYVISLGQLGEDAATVRIQLKPNARSIVWYCIVFAARAEP